MSVLPLKYYFFIVVLGILLGALGVVFNTVILKTQNLYAAQQWLKPEFRIIIPLLISVPLGLFLPLLAIGALIGSIYGNILVTVFHFDNQYLNNFIILAMAGYFTAIVRAPITGSILITEMTGTFSHLLSLSIVCVIAYLTADLLKSKPIYESLLERFIHRNDDQKFVGDKKNKVILEIAVCMGSAIDGKEIKDLKWLGTVHYSHPGYPICLFPK